jgi:RNA polymerase sigma factor (sigma-70 family)
LPAGNSEATCGDKKRVEPSDAGLWARSRAGDTEAFGLLFRRHAKIIYNYCFRRVGDWVTAEDLLSIVFLEAWRRRDTELGDKVLPWLYGIATNVIRNQRRSERRFAAALRRVPHAQPEADFADIAQARADDERQIRKALSLLRQLPRHEQNVFALCAWMELSYEDAALALGVPVGTVRSRLSRARRHLKELEPTSGHNQGASTEREPQR